MIDLSALWPHQLATYEFCQAHDFVFDVSDPGCVSHDTEFLTPTGWKKISDYKQGDLVAQFYPDTLTIDFKEPPDYIVSDCESMIHVNPVRGLNMMLSDEHRVLYYSNSVDKTDKRKWTVCSAKEYIDPTKKLYRTRKIACAFNAPEGSGLDLTDAQLRVMVALIADGTFPNNSNRCIIRVKRERKKQRVRELLDAAKIDFKERISYEYSCFSFIAPLKTKFYTEEFWKCSKHQLQVIADEVLLWDGNTTNVYRTCQKVSADFIQYVFVSRGINADLCTKYRRIGDKRPTEYNVTVRKHNYAFVGGVRDESIKRVQLEHKKKYCFTTETGFWVARRCNKIFATGNSGKTIPHAKFAEWFLQNQGTRIVIVCPKSLMRSAWQEDIVKFIPHLTTVLAEAPDSSRQQAFESGAKVVIINTDGVGWLVQQKDSWLKKHLGNNALLIVDESSYFKTPSAHRTKALIKLSKYFTKRHLLSGSPAPNSVTELWSQLKILDDGKRLGSRYTAFKNMMQYPEKAYGTFVTWADKPDAGEITYNLIKDISIGHKFEDVMPHVPAMDHNIVWYTLPKKHLEFYKQLERETVIEHEGKRITAVNAASLAGKLLQVASGAVYNDGEEKEWSLVDHGRYELIADLIEARKQVVVFFLWRHQRVVLETHFKKRGFSYRFIDGTVKDTKVRSDIVKEFQDGKLRVVLLHPLTAMHGLTLTAGTTVIFVSPVYQGDWYKQATARIRRGVQRNVTESIIVLAKDTRDYDAYLVFTGKLNRLEALNKLFQEN